MCAESRARLSVRELRERLTLRRVGHTGFVEKSELVGALEGAAAASKGLPAPAGVEPAAAQQSSASSSRHEAAERRRRPLETSVVDGAM